MTGMIMCGAELKTLPEGVQRVVQVLQARNHAHHPVMLDAACRTARQAADALGVAVGQIAKCLIFRRESDDIAILVITSGDRRVDEKREGAVEGASGHASADFVGGRMGFSIGGVSPVAHVMESVTLVDRELFRFDEIWAAAGHPHVGFRLGPVDLEALAGAPFADDTEPLTS